MATEGPDIDGEEPVADAAPTRAKRLPRAGVIEAVAGLARPVAASIDVELDRVEMRTTDGRTVVQVFIDKPGGVTIHDCVDVSRQLSAVLDVHDVVPGAFVLEVSSPGLDRPLRDEADFRRFAGRLVAVVCRRAIAGSSKHVGKLMGVEDGEVVIEQPGRTVRVPLDQVARARLEVEVE